jgi:hypothetical protein
MKYIVDIIDGMLNLQGMIKKKTKSLKNARITVYKSTSLGCC